MGQFLGASKPSIIMNCNCICTVFPPLIASAYIQYTYITKSSVKAFLCKGFPPTFRKRTSWTSERVDCQEIVGRKGFRKLPTPFQVVCIEVRLAPVNYRAPGPGL